jgi:ABC-2 type transport system ATP-binding protein
LLERAEETTIFISSHDLAEVESFASHVGYLQEGKLRFSEDMTALAARFREVEITFNAERPLPSPLPPSWRQSQASGVVVRFVESQFDSERTPADIQRVFGETKEVSFRPMGLRAIFLSMAKKKEEVQGVP